MKKFLVLTVIFAAMFFVISCGGSNNNGDNKGNNSNNEAGNNEGENNNGDSNNDDSNNGENNNGDSNNDDSNNDDSNNDDNNGSNNEAENSDCTKITPKWTKLYDEEIYESFDIMGSYIPQTGNNPDFGDMIIFYVGGYAEQPENEYDFSSTLNAGVQVFEGWHESTEEDEEGEHDNQWDRAYIAVSGKVKIENFNRDSENDGNYHLSISFQNVRLQEATIDRENEDATWTMVKDGACLFIESSSFEK